MHNGWRWFWRIIGVLAVLLTTMSLFVFYAAWTSIKIQPVAAGSSVALDSISLQIDLLALTMTGIGIGLGVIGLFGYQNIREMAVAKAVEEARRTAQNYIKLDRQAADPYNSDNRSFGDEPTGRQGTMYPANRFDPASISTEGATKESRSNDERARRDGGNRPTPGEPPGADGGPRQ